MDVVDLAKSVDGHPDDCRCAACDAFWTRKVTQRRRLNLSQDLRNAEAAERAVPLEQRELDAAEAAHAVATLEAQSLGRIANKLEGEITRQVRGADRRASIPGRLSDEDRTALLGASQRSDELSRHADRLRKEQRKAERQARIALREIDPYQQGSTHSWLCDSYALHGMLTGTSSFFTERVQPGVQERMERHTRIVADHAYRNSKYWQRIEAMYLAGIRGPDVEANKRALAKARAELRTGLTTGGGATVSASGGGTAAFAWPIFLLDQFATFRSPRRVLADQLNKSMALPDYGMQVYIPTITSTAGVGTTTEGSATTESDPSMTYASGAVVEKSGQLTLSQAILDRTGPGMSADMWVFQQLKDQLGAQIDLVAINAILANAATVTDSGSFLPVGTSGLGTNSMGKDVAAAKKALTDTAGIRLRPTHMFAISDLLDTVVSWGDAEGRPLLPFSYDPDHGQGVPDGDGYVCQMFQLQAYADDEIPASGSDTQVIVTDPKFTLLLEGTPMLRGFPQYGAASLDPVLALNTYAACVPRFPDGAAVLSGSAYATSNFS